MGNKFEKHAVNCIVNSYGWAECQLEDTARGIAERRRPREQIVILVLGLDNAGKSSVVNYLHEKKFTSDEVSSTKGFRTVKFKYKNRWEIRLYDIGGSAEFRPLWPKYYGEVHGIIFVVDAADHDRFDECEEVLKELVFHQYITYKPMLLLGNKQDLVHSLDRLRLIRHLDVYQIVNFAKVFTRVEISSCVFDDCKYYNCNRNIDIGFKWLIGEIDDDYDDLEEKIKQRKEKEPEKPNKNSWAGKSDNPFDYPDTDSDTYMKPIIILPKPKVKRKRRVLDRLLCRRNNKTVPGDSREMAKKSMKDLIANMSIEDLVKNTEIDENAILSYEKPNGRVPKKQKRPSTAPSRTKSFKLKNANTDQEESAAIVVQSVDGDEDDIEVVRIE